jgi:SAM-dependent methyltransferase
MKIQNYLNNNEYLVKKVLFGGHWSNNPGWLLLKETDQDLTQPLNCPDNVLDCIYTEHVVEHLLFTSAIAFFKESLRCLKTGGVFRLVLPCFETILKADLDNEKGEKYVYNSLVPHFAKEDFALKQLGLPGLEADARLFLLNSMANKHDHTFLWSEALVAQILKAVGFSKVTVHSVPGQGSNPEFCIERRERGIYTGTDWKVNQAATEIYDVESGVIEAIK